MNALDYLVCALAIATLLVSGFWAASRRRRGTSEFILAGRRLPWILVGTAMVSGGNSADSPLHQTGKIRRDGLGGAWFYWSQIIGYVWHALVFSRLWRRAGLNTVVEFYELRYEGLGARLGRLWAMLMTSLVHGTFVLAISLLAMIKISQVLLGLHEPILLFSHPVPPAILIVLVGIALSLAYTVAAGFLGVVAGDLVEFALAILCSYLLLAVVYTRVGGPAGLHEGLAALGQTGLLSFSPATGFSFLLYFFLQPLCLVAGDASLNQRFLAVRDEREAVYSGFWRLINHYFIRCWPWYLCALASVVLYAGRPGPAPEWVYPQLIADFMPSGLRGLMFAGFLVAFMSSVGSAMHNSGAVFVNDLYRPYLVPHASEAHYVRVIRATMVVIALLATVLALTSQHLLGLLQTLITITAASGLVMLLRWFWWRVNAWADFSAQAAGLPISLFYTRGPGHAFLETLGQRSGLAGPDDLYGLQFLATVLTTTLLWLAVMALTPPEPPARLQTFYRRVRPYGFWGPVARLCPDVHVTDHFPSDLAHYALGLILCLGLLFGLGLLLLGHTLPASALLAAASAAGWLLFRRIRRSGTPSASPPPA